MRSRNRLRAGILAGILCVSLASAGPAMALGGKKKKLDTRAGCFGAGEQGHTRENLTNAKGLKIVSVHQDARDIRVIDPKGRLLFSGKPKVGQVIPLHRVPFAYLQATTRGQNGCLVKYQPV